jgi:transcription-repair coupling factor (superfamily II helicase)
VQATDLISLYTKNNWIKELLKSICNSPNSCVRLKSLVGSLPAVLGATLHQSNNYTQLFILQNKEAAAYLYTDLLSLLGPQKIILYPAIEYQSDNKALLTTAANLMRNEILQQLKQNSKISKIIVTYPEAIVTKVIGQDSLTKNTWSIQPGKKVVLSEFIDTLIDKGFEKVDFVYEAGQFAIRGGIIDVFSYANQLPYRLELLGNEIESVRIFNPSNQLSTDKVKEALLFSYAESYNAGINYQSFFDYLPEKTVVWLKDYEMVANTFKNKNEILIDGPSQPVNTLKATIVKESAELDKVVYEQLEDWERNIKKFTCIEFGNKFYLESGKIIDYKASSQPSFNQQLNLLAENLQQNQKLGLENFILAESTSQSERLINMLEEQEIEVQFKTLTIGLSQGYVDHQIGIACYTEHQIFGRYYRYKSPQKYSKSQAFTLKELNNLQTGDYVVHIDHGIARFAGLSRVSINDKEQEVLRLVYKDNDVVYLNLHALHKISKYTGKEGIVPTMSKLGSGTWEQKKSKVKQKVQVIAKELIQLYSKRKYAPGFAFSKDTFLQAEMESSFIYEDTPDQAAAVADAKKDMEAPHPMDRLVCGDVGFGKTEVAIRAAFKAVQDCKQVAVLVPTTILALQHYESFKNRLSNFPVEIQYVNRFKSKQETKKIQEAVTQGKTDILIGTHTILSKSFDFKDLGLLIVDEEQKFGVKAKDRIKELKINVDVLTLTATPIPRTLHFSLMGARDLSIIATPPSNRQPVQTSIHTFDKKVIQEAIHYEVQRGGQVYFVHNRVNNIQEVANIIHKLLPEYRIGIAHGQMDGDQLEKRMLTFIAGGYDILVSTNIIESGLDIPNANTIIINDSHMFGLSDLHQMRGRVGRSNKKAFCYLIAPPSVSLTEEARKRLSTLEEFTELGDGFKVAMRDLDIRGAGNLLGAEQSGFIADVGFEAYCKILDETVQELKENEFKELFAEELARKSQVTNIDCALETDLELLIPASYVNNDTERLRLYTKLDNIENEKDLEKFQVEVQDRFGILPTAVQELVKSVKLRWVAKRLGIQKIRLKDDVMRCYFIPSQPKSNFSKILPGILSYIQTYPQRCQLKELKNQLSLTVCAIKTVEEAYMILYNLAGDSKLHI